MRFDGEYNDGNGEAACCKPDDEIGNGDLPSPAVDGPEAIYLLCVSGAVESSIFLPAWRLLSLAEVSYISPCAINRINMSNHTVRQTYLHNIHPIR